MTAVNFLVAHGAVLKHRRTQIVKRRGTTPATLDGTVGRFA